MGDDAEVVVEVLLTVLVLDAEVDVADVVDAGAEVADVLETTVGDVAVAVGAGAAPEASPENIPRPLVPM